MPIRTCKFCSKEFSIPQWRLNNTATTRGQYCSVTCRTKGQVGENAAHWQNKPQLFTCFICQKDFKRRCPPSRTIIPRFCSKDCKFQWMHLYLEGEHSWRHKPRLNELGVHSTYEYRQWRKEVMNREDSCRKCGSTDRLEADHILTIFIHPDKANAVDNGQVLCYDCHRLKTLDDIQDIAEHRRTLKQYEQRP